MSDDNGYSRDVLWKMYQEHCTQGRHHETQRSTVVSAIVAISTAMIGLVTLDKSIAVPSDIPLLLLLVALGVFGAGFSMKQYERFSLHMARARSYRDALDQLLPNQPLRRLKKAADDAHEQEFPRMHRLRLHFWWLTLNLIIALIGVVLLAIAVWFPLKAP